MYTLGVIITAIGIFPLAMGLSKILTQATFSRTPEGYTARAHRVCLACVAVGLVLLATGAVIIVNFK